MIVYLFELDSVRNSMDEIQTGRNALYEEIVKNGDTVVFSMNQIVDSRLFLSRIQDKNEYESIYQLFENRTLRISPQTNQATSSKHIQEHISHQDYLFSGIIGLDRTSDHDIVEKTKNVTNG